MSGVEAKHFALALLIVAAVSFYGGWRMRGQADAGLEQRLDTLELAAAAFDSSELIRRVADSVRLAEAQGQRVTHEAQAVALGDTATRLAAEPVPAAPESLAMRFDALRGVVLRLVPAYDLAIASGLAVDSVRADIARSDSAAMAELRRQRDKALALSREAIARGRAWPAWRKVLAGGSCVASGILAATKQTTPAVIAGASCVLTIGL